MTEQTKPHRRMIAGLDALGKTRIFQDGPAPHRIVHEGTGVVLTDVWCSDAPLRALPDSADPTLAAHRFFPGLGGTRFTVTHSPSMAEQRRRAAAVDMARANDAFAAQAPDMFETFDPEDAGMHRTDSVDYGVVLSGAIDLELDDGVVTRLQAGDCYVLQRARHKWRPLEDEGCVLATVLIGVPAD